MQYSLVFVFKGLNRPDFEYCTEKQQFVRDEVLTAVRYSVVNPEDGGRKFLRNAGTHIKSYMPPYSRRMESSSNKFEVSCFLGYDIELPGEWFLGVPKDRIAFILRVKKPKKKTARSFKTSGSTYSTTLRHIPECRKQHHRCEKLKCTNELRLFQDFLKPLSRVSRQKA